jgi:peptidyl-prolyl cis-trans isomerase D
MFDLFHSRGKAMRYVLIVLLSLVALSMVITLVPGFGSGSYGARSEDVLAEVCGESVTTRMVAQVVAQQSRSREFNSSMAEFLIPRMVDQFVGELATSCAANRLGIAASDSEVAQYIQTRMPMLFQDGTFVGAEAYAQYLSQMNTTIPEFEKRVRQQILLEKLQRIAFDGIVVTPREVETEYNRKGERARLDVVKFDPEELKKAIKPGKDDLEKYLKDNPAMFQVPAKRTVAMVVADPDKLGAELVVPDEQVKAMYEAQKAKFRQELKVRASHILIKAGEKAPKEEKDKARAKAEDLLKQVKAGADFAELAKKNSEDTGSAVKGGDLDFFQAGQMVPPFETAAFKLKPKEVSPVVETAFGYHVIKVTDRQEARIKPLEEVRDELVSDFRKSQVFEKMPDLAQQARAEILQAPAQAEAVAKKLGLFFGRAQNLGPGDAYPGLGPNSDLDNFMNNIPKGGVSEVVQTRDNKIYVAVVEDIVPPRPATLADMESKIRESYLSRKGSERAEELAKAFEAKLKTNGNDFKKTAADLGLKVIDTGDFERGGQMKDIGPAGYFGEQPFTQAVGTHVGVFRVGNMPYFFRIAGRTGPDPAKLEAERPVLVSTIKERKLRERREMFEDGVVSSLKGSGKIKVHDTLVKRLAQSYANRG